MDNAIWRRRFVRILTVVLAACALACAVPDGGAQAAQNNRYASIVIDAATGAVVSERYADKKLYPASLTKMMTLYLTFDALEKGMLRRNQRLPVSHHAAAQEPSKLALKPGTTIRVEDAILALVTKSANDVAVVLAEGIGGSESRFAEMMTRKARALGMSSTTFRNASGLHHPRQVSTARDMARLGQRLIRDHPRYYRYFSTRHFTYAGKTYNNHNKLMETYEGMDGIKTGYVSKSGFNLVASAVRDGRRLVGVVFGGRSTRTRNSHMKDLLDSGFAALHSGELRVASAPLPTRKPQFDAMGLVMNGQQAPAGVIEQGDAAEDFGAAVARAARQHDPRAARFEARPLNNTLLAEAGWVVQVGAFSTPEAGLRALDAARKRLPQHIAARTESHVVPLMTNRGVIYRARLSGMDRDAATHACGVLRGNCLVLSAR